MSENPIRGNPEEFERLEELFGSIRKRTEDLETELRRIAAGSSRHFRGAAADTFSENITALAPQLGVVPDIARQVEQIFCRHKTQLLQLQQEARQAIARYQTNWTSRQQAASNHEGIWGELRTVRRRLMWSWGDEERAPLESRAASLEGQERHARIRRDNAEDAYEASKQKLASLEQDENELDTLTANALRKVDVGVLADPSRLKKLADFAASFVKSVVAGGALGPAGLLLLLPTEVLEAIHGILDKLLKAATIVVAALLVVAFVLVVIGSGGAALFLLALVPLLCKLALVLSSVKLAVGLELYRRGEHSLGELIWDVVHVAIAAVSVKWGPKLDNLLGKMLKSKPAGDMLGGALGVAVNVGVEQLKGDDDVNYESGDWIDCIARLQWEFSGGVSADNGNPNDVHIPDFNLPNVALLMPALSEMQIDIDVAITSDRLAADSMTIPEVDAASLDFDSSLTLETETHFGEFELTGGDFSDLTAFVYDNPEAVPDLSNITLTQLEPGFDWHFEFSPPDEMFADFDQAFEELKMLIVPYEMESTGSGGSA